MERKLPALMRLVVYLNFALLVAVGYLFDILNWLKIWKTRSNKDPVNPDYVPLFRDFENFFYRHIFGRVQIYFGTPVRGPIGAEIEILERVQNSNMELELTGKTTKVINTGSYNYFGFGGPDKVCVSSVVKTIRETGISTGSTFMEFGQSSVLDELEKCMAEYLGVEASACFAMGFITNSCIIPTLVGPECAIFSDKLNHASIVVGTRSSGSNVFVFPHNDLDVLEKMIRKAIIEGQPRTRRPWKKMLIICEGIYSMEGNIVDLPRLIEMRKKYKIYIFLDEAHSIGAIGPRGRGIVDYYGCDPHDVDILMGTFSKSFGAVGGYIAGKQNLIEYIRENSLCSYYGTCMPPPVAAQCLSALTQIMNTSLNNVGATKIKRLGENTRYFRTKLKERGFFIVGNDDSPVVPLIFGLLGIPPEFCRVMAENKIGVVIVGFPATTLDGSRCRFCISANHTKEMLDYIIQKIDEFGEKYKIKYFKTKF